MENENFTATKAEEQAAKDIPVERTRTPMAIVIFATLEFGEREPLSGK